MSGFYVVKSISGILADGCIGLDKHCTYRWTAYIYTGAGSLWTGILLPVISLIWQMHSSLGSNRTFYWTLNGWDSHCIGRSADRPSCPVLWGVKGKRWILKGRGKDNAGDRGWPKADRTAQWRGNRQLTRLQPSEQREAYRPRGKIDQH